MTVETGRESVVDIACVVNGVPWRGPVAVGGTVLDLLRGEMGLRGAKRGCELMTCGVCTVLVDGRPISACGMFAVDLDGCELRTVEGLSAGGGEPAGAVTANAEPSSGELSPLQREFADRVAAQCGYCTSGQLMSATALIASHADERLSRDEIRRWMQTNLCRCGSYGGVVEAIEAAHARLRHTSPDPDPDPSDASRAGRREPS